MLSNKTCPVKGFSLKSLLCNLLLALFCSVLYFSEAYAQEKCAVLLEKAEEEYHRGKFNNTIELINNCLQNRGLAKSEQIRAYRLMTLSYLRSGKPQDAEMNVQRIFKLDCCYQPNPAEDEQEFIRLINKVKADQKCKNGNKKWLWLGGGGLAVAGIITAIILRNNKDLPSGLPPRQNSPDPIYHSYGMEKLYRLNVVVLNYYQ